MATKPTQTDIAIAGGGFVGLALAVALARAAPTLSVTVIDARPAGAMPADGRASAIVLAARRMLEQLGVWEAVAADAQPIEETVITDSRTTDIARPTLLSFVGPAEDGEPVAHMVENDRLAAALAEAAAAAGVSIRAGTPVQDFRVEPGAVAVMLGDDPNTALTAALVVAADGVKSKLRTLAGIRTVDWSYKQVAIVVTVEHERPHQGRAIEHFLPAGPFAILPLTGNRASLVWTERPEEAQWLLMAPADVFAAALETRFGRQLGALRPLGKPVTHPLGLMLARDLVKPRFALVGDAAHCIHPIAGQGLNLGFRDVAALAETVVEAHRIGLDIGSLQVLEPYQRWRRFETVQMGFATDFLNRLFSNDNPLLRLVRDTGLGLVERTPRLKRHFLREAAGTVGEMPRLLRGEPI